jgi:hypothetical protein
MLLFKGILVFISFCRVFDIFLKKIKAIWSNFSISIGIRPPKPHPEHTNKSDSVSRAKSPYYPVEHNCYGLSLYLSWHPLKISKNIEKFNFISFQTETMRINSSHHKNFFNHFFLSSFWAYKKIYKLFDKDIFYFLYFPLFYSNISQKNKNMLESFVNSCKVKNHGKI